MSHPKHDSRQASNGLYIVVVSSDSMPVGDFLCLDSDILSCGRPKSDLQTEHKLQGFISLSTDPISLIINPRTGGIGSQNYDRCRRAFQEFGLERFCPDDLEE